ncbi:unnamed protein product [Arctia plantaginis]|uniref:Uncharacterized protein n=1 Tax=Arctia plantaginis TaxID=874455 RepID=A0A8S1BMJ3_ARCPL|nr:unnamed protein product [Arctia plantaginis]
MKERSGSSLQPSKYIAAHSSRPRRSWLVHSKIFESAVESCALIQNQVARALPDRSSSNRSTRRLRNRALNRRRWEGSSQSPAVQEVKRRRWRQKGHRPPHPVLRPRRRTPPPRLAASASVASVTVLSTQSSRREDKKNGHLPKISPPPICAAPPNAKGAQPAQLPKKTANHTTKKTKGHLRPKKAAAAPKIEARLQERRRSKEVTGRVSSVGIVVVCLSGQNLL